MCRFRSCLVWSLVFALALPLCSQNYERRGVQLRSRIPLNQFPGNPSSGAGCSGFVSPSGREYALMGVRNGTNVVDITNPDAPVQLGRIAGPNSTWWESAVLGEFGYAVTEGGGGVRVIDLRNADFGSVSLLTTFTGGVDNVHTVQANPATNTVFLNGTNIGMVILNVSNPAAPTIAGRWTTRYVHDSVPHSYTSGQYAGKEIVFACCGSAGLFILDITNRSNIQVVGSLNYVSNGYCHSAALSADEKYLYINDEFDELNGMVSFATTWVIDVSDLSNPRFVRTFNNGLRVIDHNSSIRDEFLYLACYEAGLRVYDITDPNTMTELGFFDTYPSNNSINFAGMWGTYAKFPSGMVIGSDMQSGLFVLDPGEAIRLGARPLSVLFDRGSHVSGTLNDVRRSNDAYYVTVSGPPPASSEPNNSRFYLTYETTVTPSALLDIDAEARLQLVQTGVMNLALRNWNTGQYDAVGSLDLTSAADDSIRISNIPGGNYANPQGRIELRVQVFANAQSLRPTFRVLFDQLKVTVRRS